MIIFREYVLIKNFEHTVHINVYILPIGKFLGENPLTAIADASPVLEVYDILFCELDTNPK